MIILWKILFLKLLSVFTNANPLGPLSTFIRNDAPKWMPITCNQFFDCPRMQRRQQDGYSEVCFPGSRSWYKFRLESYVKKGMDLGKIHRSFVNIIVNEPLLVSLYQKNVKHLDVKKKKIPTVITSLTSSGNIFKCDVYFMIPITIDTGDFEFPCNNFTRRLASDAKDCAQFKSRMEAQKVKTAPKCFYAIEDMTRHEELHQKLGFDDGESLRVGIMSSELSVQKWHIAPRDLDESKEIEDEEQ